MSETFGIPEATPGLPEAAPWNEWVIETFRANASTIPGEDGRRILLLHHLGVRTGIERTTPVMYRTNDQGRPVIFASFAGASRHPQWYRNVTNHPPVHYELGSDTHPALARVATGEERYAHSAAQTADFPGFAEYERLAAPRVIPVIVLEPDPDSQRGCSIDPRS